MFLTISIELPYPEPQVQTFIDYVSSRSMWLLLSQLRLGLPSALFPSGLHPKPCMYLLTFQ
jgi:hypothetical protein